MRSRVLMLVAVFFGPCQTRLPPSSATWFFLMHCAQESNVAESMEIQKYQKSPPLWTLRIQKELRYPTVRIELGLYS